MSECKLSKRSEPFSTLSPALHTFSCKRDVILKREKSDKESVRVTGEGGVESDSPCVIFMLVEGRAQSGTLLRHRAKNSPHQSIFTHCSLNESVCVRVCVCNTAVGRLGS
ncbi:DNA oxidative demethylase ALKBH2, partial [Clarias magur]